MFALNPLDAVKSFKGFHVHRNFSSSRRTLPFLSLHTTQSCLPVLNLNFKGWVTGLHSLVGFGTMMPGCLQCSQQPPAIVLLPANMSLIHGHHHPPCGLSIPCWVCARDRPWGQTPPCCFLVESGAETNSSPVPR